MNMDEDKIYLEFADRRMELPQGISTVGRSHRCEVMIADRSASRRHALISLTDRHITVQDLGSSNGTLVNGERIHGETIVGDGDLLLIGETEIRIQAPAVVAAAVETVMLSVDPRIGDTPPVSESFAELGDANPQPALVASHLHSVAQARDAASLPNPPPSRSEAIAVGDVLPVGEVLAAPSPSWDQTGVIGQVRHVDPLLAPPGGGTESASGEVLPSLEDLEARLGDLPAAAPGPASPAAGRGAYRAPSSGVRRFAYRPGSSRDFLPPAGFLVRAGALLLDAVWMSLFAAAATLIARNVGLPEMAEGIGATLGLTLALVVPVIGWSRWGTTPGKAILGLYVCDVDGHLGLSLPRAFLRWLGYGLSAALLGLGFIMAGLNANRRALHDLIARSYVGHRARR